MPGQEVETLCNSLKELLPKREGQNLRLPPLTQTPKEGKMKTLDEIISNYKSNTIDGRDLHRLMDFVPEDRLEDIGITLKEEFVGKHKYTSLTRDGVLAQLEKDVDFGFEKALDQRGISAGLMYAVVSMWNWVLEEGLEDFDTYAQYGLPLFKATAEKYGFENPIGEHTGSENRYAA